MFRICKQHRPYRRDAGTAGNEQQVTSRIIPQIEMSRRSFEMGLLTHLEMEQKAGTGTARNLVEQQSDHVRSAGLRGDGVGPRHETASMRMRHFERNKLARFKIDGLRLDQPQIELTHVVSEILD